jgi:tryptophanyl-tRNA synthetase
VEGNVVFTYLDAFDPNPEEVEALKDHYRRGGLGDMVLKRRVEGILQEMLRPIRERREQLAQDPGYVFDILKKGTAEAREITQQTLDEVRSALGMFSFPKSALIVVALARYAGEGDKPTAFTTPVDSPAQSPSTITAARANRTPTWSCMSSTPNATPNSGVRNENTDSRDARYWRSRARTRSGSSRTRSAPTGRTGLPPRSRDFHRMRLAAASAINSSITADTANW